MQPEDSDIQRRQQAWKQGMAMEEAKREAARAVYNQREDVKFDRLWQAKRNELSAAAAPELEGADIKQRRVIQSRIEAEVSRYRDELMAQRAA